MSITKLPAVPLFNVFQHFAIKEIPSIMLTCKLFAKTQAWKLYWKQKCQQGWPNEKNIENVEWKQLYYELCGKAWLNAAKKGNLICTYTYKSLPFIGIVNTYWYNSSLFLIQKCILKGTTFTVSIDYQNEKNHQLENCWVLDNKLIENSEEGYTVFDLDCNKLIDLYLNTERKHCLTRTSIPRQTMDGFLYLKNDVIKDSNLITSCTLKAPYDDIAFGFDKSYSDGILQICDLNDKNSKEIEITSVMSNHNWIHYPFRLKQFITKDILLFGVVEPVTTAILNLNNFGSYCWKENKLTPNEGYITCLSSFGETVISGNSKGYISLWHPSSENPVLTLSLATPDPIINVQISRSAIVAHSANDLKIWEIKKESSNF